MFVVPQDFFPCFKSSELYVCTLRPYNLRLLPFFSQTNSQVRNNEMLTFGSHCCSDFRLWGVMNSTFGCWKEGGGISINGVLFWFLNYKMPIYIFPLADPNWDAWFCYWFCTMQKYIFHIGRDRELNTQTRCITTMHSLLVGALHRLAIPLFNL